jgi:hypothetical protein
MQRSRVAAIRRKRFETGFVLKDADTSIAASISLSGMCPAIGAPWTPRN